MGEIEPHLVEAEAAPLLQGPLPDQPPRVHALTLCCANSVEAIVGEVGRALEGLGFRTEVVTGSDARSAILDRGRARDQPTIYVVCVQGALKDTVVGPLRQALATHGGPDEHLFVAVLDLSLPLSMVGQVRRFAEALERMPGQTRPDPLHERRQWREHSGSRVIDENDTSTYRAVKRDQVRTRSAKSKASPPITPPRRVARIEPTRKYRAVTGPVPMVPGEFDGDEMPTVARSGRGDAPKTNRKRVRVPGLDPHAVPQETERAVAANFGAAIAEPPRSWGGAWVVLVLLLVGGAAFASYQLGAYDRFLPTELRATAVAALDEDRDEDRDDAQDPEPANDEPEDGPSEQPAAVVADDTDDGSPHPDAGTPEPAAVPANTGDGEPQPEEGESEAAPEEGDDEAESQAGDDEAEPAQDGSGPAQPQDADEPDEPEPAVAEEAPEPTEPEPEPEPDRGEDEEPVADTPAVVASAEAELSPPSSAEVEAKLARAIERRDVKVSNKYYTAATDPPKARWEGARRLCRELEIDGVDDWRLPHRRELQLLGAIGMLAKGSFWSRTVDGDDNDFAYVYELSGRRLSSWEKSEPATVVCVRKRS